MLVFVEKGKPENQPGEKPSETAVWEPTANSTNIRHWARIEPRPHWWEASDLTTVPVACLAKIGAGDPWSTGTFLFLFLILWQIENNKLGYDLYQISERDCKIFYWPRKYVIPQIKRSTSAFLTGGLQVERKKTHCVLSALPSSSDGIYYCICKGRLSMTHFEPFRLNLSSSLLVSKSK